MRLSYLFSRAGRAALAASLGLFISATPATSDAGVIVLKGAGTGTSIDYALTASYSSGVAGGDFGAHTQFLGLGASDVLNVVTDDVKLINNEAVRNNQGTNATSANISGSGNTSTSVLFKWDLSTVPGFAGSTVNAAVVRFYQEGGNGVAALRSITTHDWAESTVSLGSPAGNPITFTPNTGDLTGEWGTGSATFFKIGGATGDVNPVAAGVLDNTIIGLGYSTFDVTTDVTAFASGTPNYGWSTGVANNNYVASEHTTLLGSVPMLFLDYTPAVIPEPASALLLGVAGLGWVVRRRS